MGYRIHHSPIYQVTYGKGHFSNQSTKINRLLYDNSPDIRFDGDDIESAERLEIPRADIAKLIGKIASDPKYFAKQFDITELETTPAEFISVLCEWIANSDQRNDYVVLTWF